MTACLRQTFPPRGGVTGPFGGGSETAREALHRTIH